MQVADRWHILRNLTESVSALFPQIPAELNQDRASTKTPATSAAHESRKAQYLPVLALHQQGLSPESIALQTGMSLSTIARWLKAGHVPSGRHRIRSASAIDPSRSYLLKRWQEGCRKGSVLSRELKTQGSHGSERAVSRFLAFLQAQSSLPGESAGLFPSLSSKQTTWLLVKKPSELDEEEQQVLSFLRQASTTAETAYHLIQAFGQMVRERQGHHLEEWLKTVEESGLTALQTFAAGIQRDKAAVQAG